ncbi:hypothetical protein LEMLEM_LOCUS4611 [Lemmus lemmus]
MTPICVTSLRHIT